jgi:hypothetical protein
VYKWFSELNLIKIRSIISPLISGNVDHQTNFSCFSFSKQHLKSASDPLFRGLGQFHPESSGVKTLQSNAQQISPHFLNEAAYSALLGLKMYKLSR